VQLGALEHPPAFLGLRSYKDTFGDLAASVGEDLGMPPDTEQRGILSAIFAEDVPGVPAFFSVAVIAPRQNLKTSTLEIAALTDLFVFRVPLHVWTAHLEATAQKTFEHMVGLIASNEAYREQCVWPPRKANGQMRIELLTGERIEFRARSTGAGRGFTGNKVTLDEALFLDSGIMGALLPTMVTQRDAQVRYGSSAGLARSDVLRSVRDRGRGGKDRRLAYFEWCAPKRDCRSPDCTHARGVDGCVADDVELLAAANPAFGRRITFESLQDQRGELPPEEFIREFLGWWDEPEVLSTLFPAGAWNDRRVDAPDDAPDAFAVDMTWDREWASIGVAVGGYVDVVEHRRGMSWVVEVCQQLQAAHDVPVVIDPKGPAAPLIEPLREADVRVEELPAETRQRACGAFFDAVISGGLSHSGHPALDAAVAGAVASGGSGGWVWDRKKGAVISPLWAVTLAWHKVQSTVEPRIRSLT
jgi:hypothetical protein